MTAPGTLDAAVIERVSEGDRAWFAIHPGREFRIRDMEPGELPVPARAGDGRWHVIVRSVRPGVRARVAVWTVHTPPDRDDALGQLWRLALGASSGFVASEIGQGGGA